MLYLAPIEILIKVTELVFMKYLFKYMPKNGLPLILQENFNPKLGIGS